MPPVSVTIEEGAGRSSGAATAYFLLLVAVSSWAANLVVGRGLAGVVGPLTLSWTRWVVAFLVVLPFAWGELRARRAVILRAWRPIVGLGLVGFAGSNALCYLALQWTTAVNASLINSAGPLMMFAASVVVLGERFRARQLVGLALALIGVVGIVLRGEPRALLALEINRGDLLMLLAVGAWSVYSIQLRRRPQELSPVALVAALIGVSVVALTPLAALEARLEPSLPTFTAILYLGIFPSAVSVLCWNRAVALIGAARSSVFTYLMPLIAALLATVFLGERIEPFHLVGGGLVFAGLALTLARR